MVDSVPLSSSCPAWAEETRGSAILASRFHRMHRNFYKIAAFVIFSKTSDISSNIRHASPAVEPLLLLVPHLPLFFGQWDVACVWTSHLSAGQGLGWSMWGESCF